LPALVAQASAIAARRPRSGDHHVEHPVGEDDAALLVGVVLLHVGRVAAVDRVLTKLLKYFVSPVGGSDAGRRDPIGVKRFSAV
jgi:hypothetical protein